MQLLRFDVVHLNESGIGACGTKQKAFRTNVIKSADGLANYKFDIYYHFKPLLTARTASFAPCHRFHIGAIKMNTVLPKDMNSVGVLMMIWWRELS